MTVEIYTENHSNSERNTDTSNTNNVGISSCPFPCTPVPARSVNINKYKADTNTLSAVLGPAKLRDSIQDGGPALC